MKQKYRRLGEIKRLKVYDWLRADKERALGTCDKVAAMASTELGFEIGSSSIEGQRKSVYPETIKTRGPARESSAGMLVRIDAIESIIKKLPCAACVEIAPQNSFNFNK